MRLEEEALYTMCDAETSYPSRGMWYVLYRGLRVPDTRTILLEIHNLREKKYRR